MAVGGITEWRPPRTAGGIPRVSTRFSLSMENEQAGSGRNGRTRLARPSSQARMGTVKFHFTRFPCSADHEQDWQPYPVDTYSGIKR